MLSKRFDRLKVQECFTLSKKGDISRGNLGVIVQSTSSSSIKGPEEMLVVESTSLSWVYWICDEGFWFCFVAFEEEALVDLNRLIVFRHPKFRKGASNPCHYNSSNQRPKISLFNKMNRHHSDAAMYPSKEEKIHSCNLLHKSNVSHHSATPLKK